MERLDSRVRVVWLVSALVSAGVAAAISYGVSRVLGAPDGIIPLSPVVVASLVFLVVALLAVAHTVLRYRAWRFEVREDTLYIERGVLVKVRTVVPYVRVQHVDARRGPLQRLLGLGSVVVYTAGSRGADVSIPGLDDARTDDVQETLRHLAIESEPDSGDAGDAV
ncbi:PH domain-containing protein [Halobacterium zhouii]|uniref:PH domain-containing protein n=1 Tax=Halobacterium zhouii TaxID=2902624 RepID=UPI001E5A0280|nr:PH domain-containing protein [Halobacterium zhouii]